MKVPKGTLEYHRRELGAAVLDVKAAILRSLAEDLAGWRRLHGVAARLLFLASSARAAARVLRKGNER